uniref:Uncharacterized protein n=1 Tax=Anopheles quadriannulatus TaxID=34691 RepID=A0A2C9H8T4_ANOQN
MNFFTVSAIALVAIIGSIQAEHSPLPHYFVRKSFPEAQAECAVYLQCFFFAYVTRFGAWSKDAPLLHNLYTQSQEDAFKKDNAETNVCLTNLNKLACHKTRCEHATDVFSQCFGNTDLYKHFLAVFKDAAMTYTRQ